LECRLIQTSIQSLEVELLACTQNRHATIRRRYLTYIRLARGFVYLVAVIDWYSRRVLSWRISNSMDASFCVDCLEDALRVHGRPEVFNSDQGSQGVSIRYSERLTQAGIEPSVGSKGDSYDNALAETINGLYKAELIHRRAPWKSREAVALATLEWVAWFNYHRLLEPIGNIPPAEAEANYYRQLTRQAVTA